MASQKIALGYISPDHRLREKHQIFQELCVLAKSKDIAVVFRWLGKKVHSEECWNYPQYQSIGPSGFPDMCIFCGWGKADTSDFVRLGSFVADRRCFYENLVERDATLYLDRTDYRPALILVKAFVPGSVDDVILQLAWGLAAHEVELTRPLISPTRLRANADLVAERIVRKLERQCGKRALVTQIRANWVKEGLKSKLEHEKVRHEMPASNLAEGSL